MSEVRLTSSSLLTPAASPGTVPAVTASSQETLTPPSDDTPSVSLSGSFAAPVPGDRLEGVVIGADPSGGPILRTAVGSFALSGGPPIPDNTVVVLTIVDDGPPLQALIISENGIPLEPPPAVQLSLLLPEIDPILKTAPAQDATVQRPDTLRFVGIVLPEASAGLPGHVRALPPGSTVLLRALAENGDAAARNSPNLATPSPSSVEPSQEVFGNVNAEPIKTVLAQLPGGSDGMAPLPPGPALTPPGLAFTGAISAGGHLTGLIISPATAGQVLIRTTIGLLSIDAGAEVAPGETLALEVIGIRTPADELRTAQAILGEPISRLSHDWPALREILTMLQSEDPSVGHLVMDAAIPQFNDRLTSALLFFFTALRGGTISGWLGRSAVERLNHAGRPDLARRLGDDFADLSRLGQPTRLGDWRAIPLPLFDGGRVVQILLHARHRNLEDAEIDPDHLAVRFLLDLDFARIGPMQLDGLLQPRHFDLIIRSHAALPADLRFGISQVFEEGLSAARRRGALAFHVGQRFVSAPLAQLRTGSPQAIVV